MKRKRKICGIIFMTGIIVLFSLLIFSHARAPFYAIPPEIFSFNRKAASISLELEKQGWDPAKTRKEKLTPIRWESANGNAITFYEYRFKNLELSEDPPILYDIFDPSTAESSRQCTVCDVEAFLYHKGALSYLWWEPDEDTILVLEYTPEAVEETEIFRMAESVVSVAP